MMNDDDRRALLVKYDDRLDRHGDSPLSLGWTRGKQGLRFRILLERIASIDTPLTILDFGCGFGDLFGYLRRHHPTWEYVGVDINPRLVAMGRTKFPGARLEVLDALDALPACDYVVASGVFSSRVTDNRAWLTETLEAFARRARVGVSANFVSAAAEVRYDDLFYWSVGDVAETVTSLSRRFSIDHSYMPFEFTLHVHLDDRFDPSTTVYPEFIEYVER
jgi:SAM-dependent methyltransferase